MAVIAAVSAFGTANALAAVRGRERRTMARRGDLPPHLHADQRCRSASRRAVDLRRSCSVARARQLVEELRQRLRLHHAGFDACFRSCFTSSALRPRLSCALPASWRSSSSLECSIRLRCSSARERSVSCGRRAWRCRPARPRYLALAKRLQPGGGGESSRASGMSRRSFCAKLRRHTSLVPSGPAT